MTNSDSVYTELMKPFFTILLLCTWLALSAWSLISELGPKTSDPYQAFLSAFGGTSKDGVRQDASYGNPAQGTLHSSEFLNGNTDYFHFHLDTFNPTADLVGLVGHFLYDVVRGNIGTPCLDPAWHR